VGGRYANYMLIVGVATLLLDIVFTSLTASIGHLAVDGTPERSRAVFDELGLVAAGLYGIVAVAMLTMLDGVVSVWLGSQYTLDETILLIIVINFLVYGLMAPVMAFRQATGLFRDAKYALALTAVLNIAFSFVFGTIFGLAGILVATPVARLLANYWIEPWLLVRRHIGGGFASYLLRQGLFVVLLGLSVVVVRAINPGSVDPVALRLLAEGGCAVVVTGGIMALAMSRTSAFRTLRSRLSRLGPS
jgi:O-antigen/teichoic acid export membrane protein